MDFYDDCERQGIIIGDGQRVLVKYPHALTNKMAVARTTKQIDGRNRMTERCGLLQFITEMLVDDHDDDERPGGVGRITFLHETHLKGK